MSGNWANPSAVRPADVGLLPDEDVAELPGVHADAARPIPADTSAILTRAENLKKCTISRIYHVNAAFERM